MRKLLIACAVLLIAIIVGPAVFVLNSFIQESQLLEKPLEEYALTTEDLGSDFAIYYNPIVERSSVYKITRSELIDYLKSLEEESELWELMHKTYQDALSNGVQEEYGITFNKGENLLDKAEVTIYLHLEKYSDQGGAKKQFALIKASNEAGLKNLQTLEPPRIITPLSISNVDEDFSFLDVIPTLDDYHLYAFTFRIKNIIYEVSIADRTSTLSDNDALAYIDKIVAKTK